MADFSPDDDRKARLRRPGAAHPAAPASSSEAVSRLEEELRRTRAELAAARARCARLYDGATVGYFSLDAQGTVLAVNARGAAMLDDTPSTLSGTPLRDRVTPTDQAAWSEHLDRVLASGQPDTFTVHLRRRDGRLCYAEITAELPTATDPSVGAAAHLTVADVTARQETDEALRLANIIVEASPAYLIRYAIVDGEPGPVEYVSCNVERFGISRQALLSGAVGPRALVHPDDLPRIEAAIRRFAATGVDAFRLEYRLPPHDGQIRHVTDRVQLSRNAAGRVTAIQGLILDVTEEVQSRQALEAVLDSAPIPIVKVRLAPNGDRLLDYQNPAAARLFGAGAIGSSCKRYLCNKESCPALASTSGLVQERECRVKTRAGERVMYKTARKLPNEPTIIEAMVDVTELLHTRERLTRAMEGAEAANKAKSEFLATMSHEIRTPINGIMGMTELALQTALTDEQREYLDLARQSARALLEIINDILDFSRIEAGKLRLTCEPFSLRQTLSRCLRLFSPQADRQHDALSLTLDPGVPDALIGDAGRLLQVVGNLVSNGIKFTKGGGVRVTVETTPAVQCAMDRKMAHPVTLLFTVADTGMGIPADKQQRIFEAFTQLDGSLTRGAGGTGLGLTICNSLVALLGGRLWVESVPGAGSTFFFTALFDQPAAEALRQAADHDGRTDEMPDSRPLRILLVEDNTINQLVAKRLLERRGHTVTAVDSGLDALALLRKNPYDCILMDVEMPGLNGLETLARLRDAAVFGPAAATPVVALTAHAVTGYRERMLEAGFDDYVSKPIDMRELSAALARTTGQRAAPPDAGDA